MAEKPAHPSLYEINTRLLVRRFFNKSGKGSLSDIPSKYWESLRNKGVDIIWLMGVWQTKESGFAGTVYQESDLNRYKNILPDLQEEDLLGSPYAIDQYQLHSILGGREDLIRLRKKLHKIGLLLMLDFVPNHFGRHSRFVDENPDLFIQGTHEQLADQPHAFFESNNRVFAKAKDPYFPAWQDTVQVNYNRPETREWMTRLVMELAEICDGVRCDMAMLCVNRIFNSTWSWQTGQQQWGEEFWQTTTNSVKKVYPDFIFLAECYWNMEQELLDMGIDYCYNKSLLDNLRGANFEAIQKHLQRDKNHLGRLAHFLENHDEARSRSIFSLEQHISAAVLAYTLPGMRFYHDGQWEGLRRRIPVQLGRAPMDQPCTCPLSVELGVRAEERPTCACITLFYERFLDILDHPIFKEGMWERIEYMWKDGGLRQDIFIFRWSLGNTGILVAVNMGIKMARVDLGIHRPPYWEGKGVVELLSGMQVRVEDLLLFPKQAAILAEG